MFKKSIVVLALVALVSLPSLLSTARAQDYKGHLLHSVPQQVFFDWRASLKRPFEKISTSKSPVQILKLVFGDGPGFMKIHDQISLCEGCGVTVSMICRKDLSLKPGMPDAEVRWLPGYETLLKKMGFKGKLEKANGRELKRLLYQDYIDCLVVLHR